MADETKNEVPAEELSKAKVKDNRSLGVRVAEGVEEWGIPLVAKIAGGIIAAGAYFAKTPMIKKRNEWVREGLDIQKKAEAGEYDSLTFTEQMDVKGRVQDLVDNIEMMDTALAIQPWVLGVGVGMIAAGFLAERAIDVITAQRGKKAMYKSRGKDEDPPFPDVFERSEQTIGGKTDDYYFIPLAELTPDSERSVKDRFEIYKAAFDRRFGIEIHLADDPDRRRSGGDKFVAFKVSDVEGNIGVVQKLEYINREDRQKMLADNIEPNNRAATAGAVVVTMTMEKATGVKWSEVDPDPQKDPRWRTSEPVPEEKREEFARLVQDAIGLASGVRVDDDGRVSVHSKHLTDFNINSWLNMDLRMQDVQEAFTELNNRKIEKPKDEIDVDSVVAKIDIDKITGREENNNLRVALKGYIEDSITKRKGEKIEPGKDRTARSNIAGAIVDDDSQIGVHTANEKADRIIQEVGKILDEKMGKEPDGR